MKPVLKLGHQAFLLKNASGVAAVIKVLGEAQELALDFDRPRQTGEPWGYYLDGTVEVSFQMVPDDAIRATKSPKVEVLSPEETKRSNGRPRLQLGQ